MITTADKIAAENVSADKKVEVRFAHLWPSMRDALNLGVTPKPYYHVVSGDYAINSTVAIETLLALGIRVEVVQ